MKSMERLVMPESDYYLNTPSALAKELLLYPTIIGRFRYEPGYRIHRSRFDSFLLMLIEKGSCDIHTQGRTWRAPRDSLVLLDCYAEHEYGSAGEWQTLWLHFDGTPARAFYERIFHTVGLVILSQNTQSIRYEMETLYQDFRANRPADEARHAARIYTMLTSLLNARNSSKARNSAAIRSALTYISEHYDEAVPLEDLAAHVSLSPYYFSRVFAAETGMTPHQYLIETRISSAKYLLATTSMTVKEVAFRTGFSDESSFCASFRRRVHATPSAYQERLSRSQE